MKLTKYMIAAKTKLTVENQVSVEKFDWKLPVNLNTKNVRRGRPTGKRHKGNATSNLQETVSQSELQAVTNQNEHAPTTSKSQRRRQKGTASPGPEQIAIQPYRSQRSNMSEEPPMENANKGQQRRRTTTKKMPDALGGKPVPLEPAKLKAPTYCAHCGAKKFEFELKGLCCCNGEIQLAVNEYPQELVSLGGTFGSETYKGIYVFKAQGQVYHYLPDLIPMDSIPRYLQLYFYDGQHEKENRLGWFPNLSKQMVTLLMEIMDDNPYGKFFRSLQEIGVTKNTRIVLSTDPTNDQRVYNAPTSDEVAVVWPDNTAMQGNEGPHIITYGRGSHNNSIRHFYMCYDPLQYPLLFPKGDSGWHQGLKKLSSPTFNNEANSSFLMSAVSDNMPESLIEAEVTNATRRHIRADKRISCREYYAYKFQIRPGNILLRGGMIYQQYIVDMYVKIENTRLDFLRLNQDTIRADLYQGILDTLQLGENCASNVGKRIVLPPSFLGGPRDMRRIYLNVMALVQKYEKPDLFITMTCNPNWPEIKAELSPGEEAQNRPYLVARVFHAKLTMLRKQIKEKQIFGEVVAMINVVEFQKRGLPHAHFLIILKPAYKITAPEKFDKYVSAEIPINDNQHLRAVLLIHMMHGPCGADFPKCTLKYLYKYVYKGHDRILFNVVDGTASMLMDEIEMYQSVHTPNGQMVRFSENEELADVIDDEERAKTMLTEFFFTNSSIEGAQRYLYSEFPEHLVWNDKKKFWKPRDRGVVVERVAHASPGEGERYYIRLLLAHVRGPKSFEDLKTGDDICYVLFQEAALKRGILEEDNAADMCMDEVVQVEMPNALRRLFATILIFSCPNNPAEFWDKYYVPLSEYFRKKFPGEHGKCTRDISDALNAPVPLLQLASQKQLNVQQRTAYKAINEHVKAAKGGVFFIDGPGGTGKTLLYGAFYVKVCSIGKIYLPTTTSGIATSNLPTGRTTHSRFKIPLDTEETLTCDVPKKGGLACLIREAALIIWDEVSMAKRENIEAVNMLFQDVCNSSQLFGGKNEQPEQTLIDNVFPEIKQTSFTPEIFNDRAILTPWNVDVDSINSMLIDQFPRTKDIYHSFDSVVDNNSNVYPAEFLNSLCPAGMSQHELILKEDSPDILLRNLDHAVGLCNGTRLICKRFFPNMIECEISTGFFKGERVFLPRITLKPSKNSRFLINFQRKQFPIKLSFAMTIDKAQGQTLQRVGVHLPRSCFSDGQLYVALLRARPAKDLKVLHNPAAGDVNGNSVRNVVSFEVLRRAGFRGI
ncbi:uncharacterized protein LOC141632403 [Silene latifolia]|uniref:uncharacterized protein LOC141632403 n=1 Tax=Silene latifolia TaxID=37657 RepID=UPI003D77D8AD